MKLKVKMIILPLLMLSSAFLFRFAEADANIAAPVYAASSETEKAEFNIYDMKVPIAQPVLRTKTVTAAKTASPASASVLLLPPVKTDFKAYMDYRTITDKKAPQWQYREMAFTDENGFRRIADDYVVALGTYYATGVGERFRITLDTGTSFTVITGDIKDDKDTDPTNRYTPVYNSGKSLGGCVLEFLVDTKILDKNAKILGTVSYFEHFEGDITKIERL
jgi:hypothetical protein